MATMLVSVWRQRVERKVAQNGLARKCRPAPAGLSPTRKLANRGFGNPDDEPRAPTRGTSRSLRKASVSFLLTAELRF